MQASIKRSIRINRYGWVTALVLVISSVAHASFFVIPNEPYTDLSDKLEYLEDSRGQLKLSSALAIQPWSEPLGNTPNFGLTSSAYWFRITLDARSAGHERKRIIEVSQSDIDSMQLWLVAEDGTVLQHHRSGSTTSPSSRALPGLLFAFPETLPTTPTTLVIRAESEDSLVMPVHLWTAKAYTTKEQDNNMFLGIFYGILIVTALYNLGVYISARERLYLIYVLYCLGVLLLQAIIDGVARHYFWPDMPELGNLLTNVMIPLVGGSCVLLALDYLNLQIKRPDLAGLLRLLLMAFGVSMLGALVLPYAMHLHINVMLCIAAVFMVLGCSFASIKHAPKPAYFFLTAFHLFFLGALVFCLQTFGILPINFWTEESMRLGAVVAVTLLSIGLGDRISYLEQARIRAIEHASRTQESAERTQEELEVSKEQLVQAERLANLGVMISSLGHEISNPVHLTHMSAEMAGYQIAKIEGILDQIFDDSDDARLVHGKLTLELDSLRSATMQIVMASERLGALSNALRARSRHEAAKTPNTLINDVVNESIVITLAKTRTMALEATLDGELPKVTCFRTKVGQVVTNLISNAADALEEKQRKLKSTSFEPKISVTTETRVRNNRTGIQITVSDNGDGVPLALRQKVFEQFFTTKPVGIGTGLGLSMCRSIAEEHTGSLTVDEDPDLGGARFKLWIPIFDLAPEAQANSTTSTSPA